MPEVSYILVQVSYVSGIDITKTWHPKHSLLKGREISYQNKRHEIAD